MTAKTPSKAQQARELTGRKEGAELEPLRSAILIAKGPGATGRVYWPKSVWPTMDDAHAAMQAAGISGGLDFTQYRATGGFDNLVEMVQAAQPAAQGDAPAELSPAEEDLLAAAAEAAPQLEAAVQAIAAERSEALAEPQGFQVRPWPELLEAIRPHSEDETARLRESLERHGQQHPVLVWKDGRIIDGYHRWTVLGEAAQVQVLDALDEAEALALGITLNVARRQMTDAQLRKVDEHYRAAILRMREAGASQVEVARTLGLSQSTVSSTERAARAAVTSDSGTDSPGQPVDLRVKISPAQRRKALQAVAAGKSQRKAAELAGISLGSVQRLLREQREAEVKAAEGVELPGPRRLEVEVADKPRESARRLHEAAMGARVDTVELAAHLVRCAADEAGDAAPLAAALRRALTPRQWAAIVGTEAAPGDA